MDGSDPSMGWLLVRTQPSREQYAQQNILRWLGIESYLPLYYDQLKDKIKVLFPSYLFVRSLQWHAFKGIWGVSNVVMVGETPARLSNKHIDDLKAREQEEERQRVVVLPDPYKRGDPLRVKEGAFVDLIGLYDGMDAGARVRLLLSIFGRQTRVSLEVDQVEAA